MAISAAIPLEKMPLASVDLETTGLKPAQDRICQIGLVNPSDTTYTLDLLVDPGIPIRQLQPLFTASMTAWLRERTASLSPCPNCGGWSMAASFSAII